VGCPLCGCRADRIHSRYHRQLSDLPWQGNAVQIEITARRFFCDNRDCPQRIFTEPIPKVAARYARKTVRLADALRELTFLVGGEAAARIAAAFGLTVSPDALLTALKKAASPGFVTPRVLGVDDFAFRRGHRYGTILVDLERHCPIDLLPDRRSGTLADWLMAHPDIEIVSRDRSFEYAKGIMEGAPKALQVADRFHLLANLREAIERVVARHRCHLQGIQIPTPGTEPSCRPRAPAHRSTTEQAVKSARQDSRAQRHRQIRALREQGMSILGIAGQLGLSRGTVYHYLGYEESAVAERVHRSCSMLDPFLGFLSKRFEQGGYNGVQLCREIKRMGYPGSRKMVAVWIAQHRTMPAPTAPNKHRLPAKAQSDGKQGLSGSRTSSSRQISWFLLREPASMTLTDKAILQRIAELCPEPGASPRLGAIFRHSGARTRGGVAGRLVRPSIRRQRAGDEEFCRRLVER
jgi:transposase